MLNVFLQMIIENTVIPEMNATIYLYKNLAPVSRLLLNGHF